MASTAKPERSIDLRRISIFAAIAAGVIVASAVGILLGTNRIPELAAENQQYVTLKVVDKVVDDGTTLCVVDWNGKWRTVYAGLTVGGRDIGSYACPVPIGTDIPVIVEENIKDGVDASSLSFDRLAYLWGSDVKRD